jgi:hypothetical protein
MMTSIVLCISKTLPSWRISGLIVPITLSKGFYWWALRKSHDPFVFVSFWGVCIPMYVSFFLK